MSASVCRLCSKQESNLMNIFNNDLDSNISFDIHICIGISIKEDEEITKSICKQCFYLVKAFSELRCNAIQNDLRLKNDLEEKKNIEAEQKKHEISKKETIIIDNVIHPISETIGGKINSFCYKKDKLITPVPMETAIVDSTGGETQGNFMLKLDLTKKTKRAKSPRKCYLKHHQSINRIKSLYPNINIPKKCLKWNFDSVVTISSKIVEDWLIENNKMAEPNASSWTVNPKENNKLSLSFTRISENPNMILTEFDRFDSESIISETKSDSSFSPTVSSQETDDSYSDVSYASNMSKNSNINRHNQRKRRNGSAGKGLLIKKTKLVEVPTISNQEPSATKSIVKEPAENINEDPSIFRINDEEIATMKKNILEAISTGDRCNTAIMNNQIETVTNTIKETIATENKQNEKITNYKNIIPKNNDIKSTEKTNQKNTTEKNKYLETKEDNMQVLADLIQHDRKLSESGKEDNCDNSLLVETSHTCKTFICQTCNKVLDTQKDLNEHKKHHLKNTLRCQHCSKSFAIVEDLVRHTLKQHSNVSSDVKTNNLLTTEVNRSEIKRIAKKSTSKNSSFQLLCNPDLPSLVEDKINNENIPTPSSASDPSSTNSKSEVEQYIISSDEETENNDRNKTNSNINNEEITLNSLLNNRSNTLMNISNTVATADNTRKSIPDGNKSSPVTSVSLSDEEIYLKSVFKKYRNNKVIHKRNESSLRSARATNNYVVLNNVDKLLEKSFIPVATVPRFDNMDLSLRFSFDTNQRTKPKNTSYQWCIASAVDAPRNAAPNIASSNTDLVSSMANTNTSGNEVEKLPSVTAGPTLNSTFQTMPTTPMQIIPNSTVQSIPHSTVQTISNSTVLTIPNSTVQTIPNSSFQKTPHSTIQPFSNPAIPTSVIKTTPNPIITPSTAMTSKQIVVSQNGEKQTFLATMLSNGNVQLCATNSKYVYMPNSNTKYSGAQRTLTVLKPLPKPIYPQVSELPPVSYINTSYNVNSVPNLSGLKFLSTTATTSLLNSTCPVTSLPHLNTIPNSNVSVMKPVQHSITSASKSFQQLADNSVKERNDSNPNSNHENLLQNRTENPSHNYNSSMCCDPSNLVLVQQNDQQSNISVQNFISINIPTRTVPTSSMQTSVGFSSNQNTTDASFGESSETTTKPLLRIKDISELMCATTDQTINSAEDSLLQNYAQTVSNYVSAYSNTQNAQNTQDEYLQI